MTRTKTQKPFHYEQKLVFLKEWYQPGCVPKARPVPVEKEPNRVWTLFLEGDENRPPHLPIVPVHGRNAFAEDYMHDWNWRKGMFDYASRVADRPVWVLLEYKVED